jgi:protoheme ferro-lyase
VIASVIPSLCICSTASSINGEICFNPKYSDQADALVSALNKAYADVEFKLYLGLKHISPFIDLLYLLMVINHL